MTPTKSASRQRRSFSQKNLASRHDGPWGTQLLAALKVPSTGGYVGTHGFHPYPGRFHPHLAHSVLKLAGRPGIRVLDPFMGGGTTLVEAMRLGQEGWGNDLNPVALLVARERTRPRDHQAASELEALVQALAEAVMETRTAKKAPLVRRAGLERVKGFYAPHILAEMIQWITRIDALPEGPQRETLRAVFSSLVVKFSLRRSDSAEEEKPVAHPKGAISRFMVAKCRELLRAQQTLLARGKTPPRVTLLNADARHLDTLPAKRVDLLLTSPPYPGTYDYADQHRLRMDWLQLNANVFEQGELGARRAGENAVGSTWRQDMTQALGEMARLARPGASLFLVVGDWLERSQPVDGRLALQQMAATQGWQAASWASIQRETFHSNTLWAKSGKWEHILQCVKPMEEPFLF